MRRVRLDTELVRRGLARSREHAASLIHDGRVSVAGSSSVKAATAVGLASAIVVTQAVDGADYVSRGGHKLAGALDVFEPSGLQVSGRRALDAGASTGGFTDVLLRRGACHVVAVDVGYGQLAWSIRSDPRVQILDRTNIRDLTPELIGGPVELVVADLSFISLRLVLAALRDCVSTGADLALMVKPQFEVGKERVGTGGVVRDPELRALAVRDVATAAYTRGLGLRAVTASPLPGPSGNVEYFCWFRLDAPAPEQSLIDTAVREGPQ